MFTALASAKGLDYRVTLDASVPSIVRTDAMRLQQILGNLLGPRPSKRFRGTLSDPASMPFSTPSFLAPFLPPYTC